MRLSKYMKLITPLTTQYFEVRKYEDGYSMRFYLYRANGAKCIDFTQDADGVVRINEPSSDLSYMHNAVLKPCQPLEYKEATGTLPTKMKERSNV